MSTSRREAWRTYAAAALAGILSYPDTEAVKHAARAAAAAADHMLRLEDEAADERWRNREEEEWSP